MYVYLPSTFVDDASLAHFFPTIPPHPQGLKYVTKDENGGRRITKEGQTALDQIAASVANREEDEE